MNIGDWKNIAEIARAMATTIAILTGSLWAYLKYIKNRLIYPNAELSHEVFIKSLGTRHK
jgi:hypothetical protein